MGNDIISERIETGRHKYLSKIQGSLIGGAAGDALGYEVEFMSDAAIRARFGPDGITDYELSDGKALFSDDTQMTLFTANGLLYGETRRMLHRSGGEPHTYIPYAYRDWLFTQDPASRPEHIISWMADIPELHSRRAPGNTCISAIRSGRIGSIENPLNNSCGCGGVMRVAPVGLFYGQDYPEVTDEDIVRYGAYAAVVTHGHPWGYIPAGMMSLIVNKAAFTDDPLPEVIRYSFDVTEKVFGTDDYWEGFASFIRRAVELSGNDETDRKNIRALGEGWVGHEALAIALYAALRHEHDFSGAMVAAVNHDGDSDSTGAVAGNILGAYLGLEGIDPKWTEHLELRETILSIGTDLCDHCRLDGSSDHTDPQWLQRYDR